SEKLIKNRDKILLRFFLGITVGLAVQARPETPLLIAIVTLPALLSSDSWTYGAVALSAVPYVSARKAAFFDSSQDPLSVFFSIEGLTANLKSNFKWLLDFK